LAIFRAQPGTAQNLHGVARTDGAGRGSTHDVSQGSAGAQWLLGPRGLRGEVFQDPPAGLQTEGRQNLGYGMFLLAQHHTRDPWHEARPAGPGEHRDKGAQQRLSLRPLEI
jgi:hypothetical protein